MPADAYCTVRETMTQGSTPVVSIVLPTYNRLACLREAVASVRAQTIAGWELIVVDDGSTDGTADWVAGLDDARVRLLAVDHCGFPSRLRNRGIAAARAEWIAFIDSDDLWVDIKLERQLDLHRERPHLRWSCTGFEFIDAVGAAIPGAVFRAWPEGRGLVRALLLNEATLALPSVMMARSLLTELRGFDERFQFVEDFELWFRACRRADCGIVDLPLLKIRRHAGSSSRGRSAEIDGCWVQIYSLFAQSAESAGERRLCRRQEALHAVWLGRELAARQEWARSHQAFARALRLRPIYPWAWKCLVQATYRRMS
jgi:glycosyltransferase involved in cell wall biosynthesis